MSLEKLNDIKPKDLRELLIKCCGAEKWVNKMVEAGTFKSKEDVLEHSQKTWYSLERKDWLEAFEHHPKIGDINSLKEKFSNTKEIAGSEQSGVNEASLEILSELAQCNSEYEKRFGYIFIVCATGKSADEMLTIIKDRMGNDPETEVKIAMEEQNKITKLRLEKLL